MMSCHAFCWSVSPIVFGLIHDEHKDVKAACVYVLPVDESWQNGKMQDLVSAASDLERAFDHTAAHLQDLVDKCDAEQVC